MAKDYCAYRRDISDALAAGKHVKVYIDSEWGERFYQIMRLSDREYDGRLAFVDAKNIEVELRIDDIKRREIY